MVQSILRSKIIACRPLWFTISTLIFITLMFVDFGSRVKGPPPSLLEWWKCFPEDVLFVFSGNTPKAVVGIWGICFTFLFSAIDVVVSLLFGWVVSGVLQTTWAVIGAFTGERKHCGHSK